MRSARFQHGRDLVTGRPAEVLPTPADLRERALAPVVADALATLSHPSLVPVVRDRDVIAFLDPPSAKRPERPVPMAHAATAGIQLCDLLDALHAMGVYGLSLRPEGLRVAAVGNELRARALLPRFPAVRKGTVEWPPPRGLDRVRADLWRVATFVLDLASPLSEAMPWMPPMPAWRITKDRPSQRARGSEAQCLSTLERWGVRERPFEPDGGDPAATADLPQTPAELARWLAAYATPSGRSLAAAMTPSPAGPALQPSWDETLAEAEAELVGSKRRDDRYLTLPLAAAHHARACQHLDAGRFAEAEADLARALELDPFVAYGATLCLVRAARGDAVGARRALEPLLSPSGAPTSTPQTRWDGDLNPGAEELARGHYVLGRLLQDLGSFEEARTHFRRAQSLADDPSFAYAEGQCDRAARGTLPWTFGRAEYPRVALTFTAAPDTDW